MSTVQTFLPYDNRTLTAYTTWAQGIGTALSTLGWVKQTDTGAVTWADITSYAYVPQVMPTSMGQIGTLSFTGAWATATAYFNGTSGNGSGWAGNSTAGISAVVSVVTNSNVTWLCTIPTSILLTNVLPNVTNSFSLTSVAGSTTGSTVYSGTITGGAGNAFAGYAFTVSGFTNSSNNGTFICTASAAGTLTLATMTQTLATPQTITTITETHAATAASSSNNTTYYNTTSVGQFGQTTSSPNQYSSFGANCWYSLSVNISGFTNAGNNGNFSVIVSVNTTSGTPGGAIVVNNSGGVLETHAGTIIAQSAPTTDTFHWVPYNYEIWKTNGTNSTASPIYMKIVYASSGGTTQYLVPELIINVGSGYTSGATGTVSGNNTGENYLGLEGISTGQGDYFECDFSGDADTFAMILWRNAVSISSGIPIVFFIDRARDSSGNALPAYFVNGFVQGSAASGGRFWTIFPSGQGSMIPASGGSPAFWNAWPVLTPGGSQSVNSGNYAGLTPVFPIHAVPGYVSNPCLLAVGMMASDFQDGELVNAVVYGASHTFMMSKSYIIDYDLQRMYPGIKWD